MVLKSSGSRVLTNKITWAKPNHKSINLSSPLNYVSSSNENALVVLFPSLQWCKFSFFKASNDQVEWEVTGLAISSSFSKFQMLRCDLQNVRFSSSMLGWNKKEPRQNSSNAHYQLLVPSSLIFFPEFSLVFTRTWSASLFTYSVIEALMIPTKSHETTVEVALSFKSLKLQARDFLRQPSFKEKEKNWVREPILQPESVARGNVWVGGEKAKKQLSVNLCIGVQMGAKWEINVKNIMH